MWFTNALTYTFTKPFNTSAEELELALSEHPFRACGQQDLSKQGWFPVIPNTVNYVHQVGDNLLIALKTQTKNLPATAVNQALAEKVSFIEHERGQKVGKKERMTLKEELVQSMLPNAFPIDSMLYAYIDLKGQRIVVNASTSNKAENFLANLRQTLGSLPILPFKPDVDLLITLTEWVKNDSCPSPFELGQNCQLKALDEEAAKAKLDSHDLSEDEVQIHLANGKYVHQLGLAWDNKVLFNLNDDGSIKKIKFLDVVKEQNDDVPAEDKAAKFDADFALMAGELNQLLGNLDTEYQGQEAA